MATDRQVQVGVVEDHPFYRRGLVDAINRLGGYDVVVQAANGEEYIRACKKGPKLDIALIDLFMPVMDGWSTIAWVRDHQPGTVPAAISFDPTPEARQRAYRCGARGIVDKYLNESRLRVLLEDLSVRKFHFNELMESAMKAGKEPEPVAASTDAEKLKELTKREKEILEWVLKRPKLTFAQIGVRLGIEESTVETHCKNIYLKLGLKDREDLCLFAGRNGL